jgi:hypothetical protein
VNVGEKSSLELLCHIYVTGGGAIEIGGFAGVKLSGSLRMYGSFRFRIVSIMIVIANPIISFTVK